LLSGNSANDVVLAAAPEHGSKYLRPHFEGQHGYTLLFKSSLLAHQLAAPANEFPFFLPAASLTLPVPGAIRERLLPQLQAS
jgi:hypothetical protein